MKSIVSFLAVALLALGPVTLLRGQSSPTRATTSSSATSKASPSAAAVKPSPSPVTSKSSPSSSTSTTSSPAASVVTASPSPELVRTDVYHVHFTKAAAGKATQLADNLKKPDTSAPYPGHVLVLRHQDGDSWDYAVIQHMGTSTTIDAVRPAPSPGVRDLSDWHNDTYVNGPSWAEFTKAMGIDESGDKSKSSAYVISVYRPIAGHRDQLEKMLSEPPSAGDTSAGNVLMQHLEGGPWTFLTIARYKSWQDFGTNESNAVASTNKNEGGWFQLRELVSFHNDTVCDRIAP